MKIRRRKEGRGIRAILCSLVSILCIAICGMSVEAGYTSDNHPSAESSPDGNGWTIVDELPYSASYDSTKNSDFSWWEDKNTIIDTSLTANPQIPGEGQHNYDYERKGYIPVDYWKVLWKEGRCIHGKFNDSFVGINNLVDGNCYSAYWSGVMPYCTDCGNSVTEFCYYSLGRVSYSKNSNN